MQAQKTMLDKVIKLEMMMNVVRSENNCVFYGSGTQKNWLEAWVEIDGFTIGRRLSSDRSR